MTLPFAKLYWKEPGRIDPFRGANHYLYLFCDQTPGTGYTWVLSSTLDDVAWDMNLLLPQQVEATVQ